MKYYYQVEGLLRNNIGDVLQGMVAKAFLPPGAEVVDREALAEIDKEHEALFIANGWYMHSFEKFPPPLNVKPVYISVHVADSKLLASKKVRQHFIDHGPVGCRDTKTLQLFLGWGIPAYYSGCLTVTASSRVQPGQPKNDEILLVDNVDHPVPEAIKTKIEKMFGKALTRVSHDPPVTGSDFKTYAEQSEEHMDALLKRYCEAKLVVTTKIHCALPCLGMGANVLLIHPNPADPRLATVGEFIDIVSFKEILANDSIRVPAVKQAKLRARKQFLSGLVTESVKNGFYVVQKSSAPKYRMLRLKSALQAKLFRTVMLAGYKIGLNKAQIEKVYGSEL